MSMKPFCETIVLQVLPTVRSLLAMKLSEKGVKNKKISELMGLSPAAVTQYLKKARGSRVKVLMKSKAINKRVDAIAEKMAEGGLSHEEGITTFCEICKEIRKERILCKLHEGPADCTVCMPISC